MRILPAVGPAESGHLDALGVRDLGFGDVFTGQATAEEGDRAGGVLLRLNDHGLVVLGLLDDPWHHQNGSP